MVTTFLLSGKRLRQEEAGFPAGVDSRVTAGERLGRDRLKNTNLSGKWLLCRVSDVRATQCLGKYSTHSLSSWPLRIESWIEALAAVSVDHLWPVVYKDTVLEVQYIHLL